jgi:hypothetical protein
LLRWYSSWYPWSPYIAIVRINLRVCVLLLFSLYRNECDKNSSQRFKETYGPKKNLYSHERRCKDSKLTGMIDASLTL